MCFRENNFCIKSTLDTYFKRYKSNNEIFVQHFFQKYSLVKSTNNFIANLVNVENSLKIPIVLFKHANGGKKKLVKIYEQSKYREIPIYFLIQFQTDISLESHLTFLFDLSLTKKKTYNTVCYKCSRELSYNNIKRHQCILQRCNKCKRFKDTNLKSDSKNVCLNNFQLKYQIKCSNCNISFDKTNCFNFHLLLCNSKSKCEYCNVMYKSNQKHDCNESFCRKCCTNHCKRKYCYIRPLYDFKQDISKNFYLHINFIDTFPHCFIISSIDRFKENQIICYSFKNNVICNQIIAKDTFFDNSFSLDTCILNQSFTQQILNFFEHYKNSKIFASSKDIEYIFSNMEDQSDITIRSNYFKYKDLPFIPIENFIQIPLHSIALYLNENPCLVQFPSNISLNNDFLYNSKYFSPELFYFGNSQIEFDEMLIHFKNIDRIIPKDIDFKSLKFGIALYRSYVICKYFFTKQIILKQICKQIKSLQESNNIEINDKAYNMLSFNSYSSASFNLFRALLLKDTFVCLPSQSKKISKGTSIVELSFINMLSKIHGFICKSKCQSIIDEDGSQFAVSKLSLGEFFI